MRIYPANLLLGIAAIATLTLAAPASADTGRTPGRFGVASTGAAQYTVPIWVQPGPKGVQPSLAFSYDSQALNGAMGVGWNLAAGLSSVERCPATSAQDGSDGAVTLTNTDRLCLGGNRLRSQSGTYGTGGSTYFTEVANFSRITASGTVGDGAQMFTVEMKDGRTFEYGGTPDSRPVYSGSSNVLRWLVSKVKDRDGNSYAYAYTTDTTVGVVPLSISWGPTAAGGSTYQYRAYFNYSNKSLPTDMLTSYLQGVSIPLKQRLDKVEIQYAADGSSYTTQRQYQLTYVQSPTTQLTRLTQIQECGTSTSTCLLPTTIGYQNGAPGLLSGSTTAIATAIGTAVSEKVDFNGDGRTDIAYNDGTTWRVALSTGGGFSAAINTTMPAGTSFEIGRFVSTHRDGFIYNSGGTVMYVGFNGVSFSATNTGTPWVSGQIVTDYNGDGLQDFIWSTSITGTGRVWLRPNVTTGAATVPTFSSTPINSLTWTNLGSSQNGGIALTTASGCPFERQCDLDGDGRADLQLVVANPQCSQSGCAPNYFTGYDLLGGMAVVNPTVGQVPIYKGIRFNDDPCTDTIRQNTLVLRVSKCGTAAPAAITLPAEPIAVIDWDGDHRTDLVVPSGSFIGIYKSRGSLTSPFDALITTSIPYSSTCRYYSADFDADGLDDLACAATVSPFNVVYYTHNGGGSAGVGGLGVFASQIPDLANNFQDGYGNTVSPSYVSTSQSNYTAGSNTAYPLVDATEDMTVVGRMTVSDGIGSVYTLDYTYSGARRNGKLSDAIALGDPAASTAIFGPDGRFAGFETTSVVDSRNTQKSTTSYDQDFPRDGMVKGSELLQGSGTLITRTTNVNSVQPLDVATNQRYFTYLSKSTVENREVSATAGINGMTSSRQVTDTIYSDFTYGNPSQLKMVITDEDPNSPLNTQTWTTTVDLTYEGADTGSWCVGLPRRVTTTQSSTAPGASTPIVRAEEFSKDTAAPAKCRSNVRTTEPDNAELRIVETSEFDAFGNVRRVKVVGTKPNGSGGFLDMAERNSYFNWGSTGQFVREYTDAVGDKTTREYKQETGTLSKIFDANSSEGNPIATSFLYDDFNRMTRMTKPDNTSVRWSYDPCATAGCLNGFHRMTVTKGDYGSDNTLISDDINYLDTLERPLVHRERSLNLQVSSTAWDGSYQWSELEYDALGRLVKQYIPCLSAAVTPSCKQYATTIEYDGIGRVVKETRQRSLQDTNTQSTTYGYAGRTQTVKDAQDRVNTRVLDVLGQMRETRDANNYSVYFTPDAAGTVTSIVDSQTPGTPKLSGVIVKYGAVPLVTYGVDTALGTRTLTYNSLGELLTVKDTKNQVMTLEYDDVSRMKRRLEPDTSNMTEWTWGTNATGNTYDKGKLQSVATTAAGSVVYRENYTYDERARVKKKQIVITGDPDHSAYDYDYIYGATNGLATRVDYPASVGTERFSLNLGYLNGELQSTSGPGGAPQVWTARRSDAFGQLTEEAFGNNTTRKHSFDPVSSWLDTIKTGTSSDDTSLQSLKVLHDLVGNVIQRQNNKVPLNEDIWFDQSIDKLYRLEHTTLGVGAGAPTNLQMRYDLSGNILSKNVPNQPDRLIGQTIAWTPFNYPAQITSTSDLGTEVAAFSYGPQRQRWKMAYQTSAGTETTYYIGSSMEKVVKSSGTIYRHTLPGLSGPAALYTRGTGDAGTYRYVFTDHQGSVETIATSAGAPERRESFTPFGERRDATDWSGAPADAANLDDITRQGYTYQTVLGSMGLNHMNGRVQDAVNGRFLSPDPYITDHNYTQNYNRYAYVYNNPVTFKDPSGFGWEWECQLVEWETFEIIPGDKEKPDSIEIVNHWYNDCTPIWTEDPPTSDPQPDNPDVFDSQPESVPPSETPRKSCSSMSLPSDSRIADVRTSSDYYHTYTRYHFTLPGDAEIAPDGSLVPAGVAVGAYVGSAGGMAYGTYAGAAYGAAHGRNLGIVFGTMAVGEAAASGAVLGGLYGGIAGAVLGAGIGVTATNGMKVYCEDPR